MAGAVYSAGLELRAAGDGSRRLTGRFPYLKLAVLDAGGRGRKPQKEQFAPKAFSYAVEDQGRDIHLLVGHDFDAPLASRKSGTLAVVDTEEALSFEATLTPAILRTTWGANFIAAFEAGLITGLSPGFRVPDLPGAQKTETEDPALGQAIIRTIAMAVLFE